MSRLGREMRYPGFFGRGFPREIGEADAGDAADILQSLQREIAAREHALDARLAQTQSGGDCRVLDVPPFQHPLQHVYQCDRVHRRLP
jgi:hypothetical protein